MDRLVLVGGAGAQAAVLRRRRARCGQLDRGPRRPARRADAAGESRKRSTIRLSPAGGRAGRVVAQDLDVAPGGQCRRAGSATASARSSSAASTITSASASSPSSSSSGFVKAACAGPRRPTTTTSRTLLRASTSSAWSAVSVGASSLRGEHEHARDVEGDVAVADHHRALGREPESSSRSVWSGWPLYQPTNSVAACEPGSSSPGIPSGRSDGEPVA